jgi:hypothetical protein
VAQTRELAALVDGVLASWATVREGVPEAPRHYLDARLQAVCWSLVRTGLQGPDRMDILPALLEDPEIADEVTGLLCEAVHQMEDAMVEAASRWPADPGADDPLAAWVQERQRRLAEGDVPRAA